MSYTTYYLRFNSQEEADTKLTEVGYKHEDTFNEETRTYYAVKEQVGDIDVVGDVYNNDGVYETGEDGMPIVVSEPTKKDGWHINVILQGALPEALEEFVVTPANPYRVFA